jgi:hypothetical protein
MEYLAKEFPACKINLISAYDHVPPGLRDPERTTIQVLEKPLRLNSLKDYL